MQYGKCNIHCKTIFCALCTIQGVNIQCRKDGGSCSIRCIVCIHLVCNPVFISVCASLKNNQNSSSKDSDTTFYPGSTCENPSRKKQEHLKCASLKRSMIIWIEILPNWANLCKMLIWRVRVNNHGGGCESPDDDGGGDNGLCSFGETLGVVLVRE